MSSQTSKAALRGLEQAEWLATSTETQMPTASGELDELYRAVLPEGTDPTAVPDFDVVQGANVFLLVHATHKLRHADQAHRKNLVALDEMRNRRVELAQGFKKRYRDERKSFEGTYGEDSLPHVGLDAPPARSYLGVREQVLEFRERLRDPETPARLGDPLPGHSPVEPETLATAVDGEVDAYKTLMTDIREQRKRTDESQSVKDAAIADHRRVVVNVARIQEGYYRLVGLDHLADRIRAARRRRKAKPPDETDKPDTTDTADDTDTAEPTEPTDSDQPAADATPS